jgi:GWxTD domain-containing protein
LPTTIRDIDKAVDQLRYIAKDEDMEFIRQGKDPDERKKRFQEFWQKRDPDPRTAQNELMEEYYARVSYANEHFSHFVDGWRTDMGMVYIRFGPPENIERHPFETDTRPYEVWYYYQLNRQFIFVDRNGFGDYRLNYPDLDLWGRIR